MDLINRKAIRLKDYDYSGSGAYFITICTYNNKNLFFDTVVSNIFRPLDETNINKYPNVGANLCVRPNNPHLLIEKWLLELENKYKNIKIQKYVIMPNHIHFILIISQKTGEHAGSPLHEMIKWFKTQTTNEYIRAVKNNLYPPFEKYVWQRNYYEHIIRNQNSYNKIWQYIDENPLKWELDKYYSK